MVNVASGTGLSVAANSTSNNLVTGTYEFAPFDGVLRVYQRTSANGMKSTLVVDGTTLVNDQDAPFFGTSGALSKADHLIAEEIITQGSRIEYKFRNTTAGALTGDYAIDLDDE